jgi:hypothetical protein
MYGVGVTGVNSHFHHLLSYIVNTTLTGEECVDILKELVDEPPTTTS